VSSAGEHDWPAEHFEANRPHLRAVALRMFGSPTEADDDALQEAWIKVSRADTGGVENIAGWFTTVVARVALDMLRSHRLPGLIWAPGGRPRVVWQLEISGGRVAQIVMLAHRERIGQLALTARRT
jgi:DNA-directed RNA polymerase specialized sigma24 family protein